MQLLQRSNFDNTGLICLVTAKMCIILIYWFKVTCLCVYVCARAVLDYSAWLHSELNKRCRQQQNCLYREKHNESRVFVWWLWLPALTSAVPKGTFITAAVETCSGFLSFPHLTQTHSRRLMFKALVSPNRTGIQSLPSSAIAETNRQIVQTETRVVAVSDADEKDRMWIFMCSPLVS